MELKKLKNIKITYLAAILGAGVVLMVLSNFMTPGKEKNREPPPAEDTVTQSSTAEQRLGELIEDIDGVSDVSVFVAYENNGVRNIAMSGEESVTGDGDKRVAVSEKQPVTEKDGSREQPFVTEEVLPQVRGVIIAARSVGSCT